MQLQADLVSYVGELLYAGANSGGHITTGGTESIILATMAARNWSRMHRPASCPGSDPPEHG